MERHSLVRNLLPFVKRNGFRHIRCASYHPANNGLAERTVHTFKEALKMTVDGDMDTHLARFLFWYRSTPHSTTGKSLKQLQKEMKIVLQGQQETALRLARSARKENYSFKRRRNKLQFRFNEELAEKVEVAKAIVETVGVPSGSRSEEELQRVAKEMSEDVFSSGVWPLLSNLENPELRRLAQALPATVLRSRADSTSCWCIS